MFTDNSQFISIDRNYQVIDASRELKEKYSWLFPQDFFTELLTGYEWESFSAPVLISSGIYTTEEIKLFFVKDDNVLKCCPVKDSTPSEDKLRNIHYRLREPLSSIFAVMPLIADNINKNNSEKSIENLETINRQSYKLLKNMNNLSLADRILSGNMPVVETVDFSSLLENLVFAVKTVQRNITIRLNCEESIVVRRNKKLLTAALLNLIANSVNFKSEEKVIIDISLKTSGSQAVFSYSDNSKGIQDVLLTDIFKPFFSKDPFADGESDPALGIGLYIVKVAFEQSGGKIITSSVFGKGVKYITNIPLTENGGHVLESNSAEFLLNRYSDLYVQLCDSCQLPALL